MEYSDESQGQALSCFYPRSRRLVSIIDAECFSAIILMNSSASCATIVRLRYLTLYDDQSEFMFSTGAIGLWSIVEEGIGIIAGSMPALRPLLSLPIFGRSSVHSNSHQPSTTNSRLTPNPRDQLNEHDRSILKMNTYRTHVPTESAPHRSKPRMSSDDDGDSQKNILKVTRWTITAESSTTVDDWSRQQALGWENRLG